MRSGTEDTATGWAAAKAQFAVVFGDRFEVTHKSMRQNTTSLTIAEKRNGIVNTK
jgi:hypothetical protein